MDRNEKQNSYRNTRMTRGIPSHPSGRMIKTSRKTTHLPAAAVILLILILGAGSFTFYVHRNQEKETFESGGTVAVSSPMPVARDGNQETGAEVIMTIQTGSPGAEEGRESEKPEGDSENPQEKNNGMESESGSMTHSPQETNEESGTTEEPVPYVTEPATEGTSEPETEQETERETELETERKTEHESDRVTEQETDGASASNTERKIILNQKLQNIMFDTPESEYRIILKEWRTDQFENVISLPEHHPEPGDRTSDERLINFFTLCYTYHILDNLENENNILRFLCQDMNDKILGSRKKFPVVDSKEAIRQIFSRIGYWTWSSDRDLDEYNDKGYTYDPSDPYEWQDLGKNAVQSFASAQSEGELSDRADQAAVLLSRIYKGNSALWSERDIFRNLKKQLQASPSVDAQNSMFVKQFLEQMKESFTCYWIEDMEYSDSGVCAAFLLEPVKDELPAYILVLFSDSSSPDTQEKLADNLADYVCGMKLESEYQHFNSTGL